MSGEGARAVIELDRVDKFFGATPAVLDLSFKVMEGDIVALLGRTGAGKSTALHMIMGVMEATRGTVRVEGLDPYNQFKELRGKLAVSFQTDRLLPWLDPSNSPTISQRSCTTLNILSNQLDEITGQIEISSVTQLETRHVS